MRAEDPRAIEEFVVRAQRTIHDRARQSGIPYEACDDCTVDVVDDVALLIVTGKVRPSRSIGAYVMKVFRTRLAQRSRDEQKRTERERQAGLSDSDARQFAAMSEDAWRSSHASADDGALPVSSALARLAEVIEGGVTAEERRILEWLSNYVSQRDICRWLGVSYAAGTQRLWRLRERLKRAALAHASAFSEADRREVNRFLRWAIDGAEDERPRGQQHRDAQGGGQ
jgi:hypothetical protein